MAVQTARAADRGAPRRTAGLYDGWVSPSSFEGCAAPALGRGEGAFAHGPSGTPAATVVRPRGAIDIVQRDIDITDYQSQYTYVIPLPDTPMDDDVIKVVYNNRGDSYAEAKRRYRATPKDVQQVLHGLSLIGWRGTGEALRKRVLQDAAAARFFRSGEQPLEAAVGDVGAVPPITRLYRGMIELEFVQLRRAIAAAEADPTPQGQAKVHGSNDLILSDADEERRVSALVAGAGGNITAPTGHMGGIAQSHHHFEKRKEPKYGKEPKYLVEFKLSWPPGTGPPGLLLGGAMRPGNVYPQPTGGGRGALANVHATRGELAGFAKGGEGYPNIPGGAHNAVGLKAENTQNERLSLSTAPFPSTHGLERLRHLAPRLDVQIVAVR